MVCLLCDFKILLTVFNQSYNCQTSHYLGRNQLSKLFQILPSLGYMVDTAVPGWMRVIMTSDLTQNIGIKFPLELAIHQDCDFMVNEKFVTALTIINDPKVRARLTLKFSSIAQWWSGWSKSLKARAQASATYTCGKIGGCLPHLQWFSLKILSRNYESYLKV